MASEKDENNSKESSSKSSTAPLVSNQKILDICAQTKSAASVISAAIKQLNAPMNIIDTAVKQLSSATQITVAKPTNQVSSLPPSAPSFPTNTVSSNAAQNSAAAVKYFKTYFTHSNLPPQLVTAISTRVETNHEFFPNFTASATLAVRTSPIHSSFMDEVEYQRQEDEKIRLKNELMNKKLEELLTKNSFSEAYRYWKLQEVIKELRDQHQISPSIILFKVMQFSPKLATYLRERKSPMRVVIDDGDIQTFVIILQDKPDRREEKIFYLGKNLSELEYAIASGSVEIVKAFLEIAETFGMVELGGIPQNALFKALKNQKNLIDITLGEKELREHYFIDLRLVTEKNIIRLLRELKDTLPRDEKSINELLTSREYPVFKYLLGKKQDKINQSQLIFRKKKFIQNLLTECNSKLLPFRAHDDKIQEVIDAAIKQFKNINFWIAKKNFSTQLESKPNDPLASHIAKHATKEYEKIMTGSRSLEPSGVLMDKGLLQRNINLAHDMYSIFFGHDSEFTDLTTFRKYIASHIISLDILRGLENGLIAEKNTFTGPHFYAYVYASNNPPILFFNKNFTNMVIWRVTHVNHTIPVQRKKIYRLDYYVGNELIKSIPYEKFISEEIYRGGHIKVSAWKFFAFTRKLAAVFPDNFYDYILDSYNHNKETKPIEATRAVVSNVYQEERKFFQSIPLDNDAISCMPNPFMWPKDTEGEERKLSTQASDAMKCNNDESLLKILMKQDIQDKELYLMLVKTVSELCIDSLKFLLDSGVEITFKNYLVLRKALETLKSTYFSYRSGEDKFSFEKAKKILNLLLFYGRVDKHDSHIRYVADIDCCSLSPTGNIQTDQVADLRTVLEVLVSLPDEKVSRAIINSVSKLLPMVASYVFIHCYEQLMSLMQTQFSSELQMYTQIDQLVRENKNPLQISEILQNLLQTNNKLYFIILSCGIKHGNESVVSFFQPICKEIEMYKHYFPLHRAIELGQTKIAMLLMKLGETDRLSLANEHLLDVAVRCDNFEMIEVLNVKFPVSEGSLLQMLKTRHVSLMFKIWLMKNGCAAGKLIDEIVKKSDLMAIKELINLYVDAIKRNDINQAERLSSVFKSIVYQQSIIKPTSFLSDILSFLEENPNQSELFDFFYMIARADDALERRAISIISKSSIVANASTADERGASKKSNGKKHVVELEFTSSPFWKKSKTSSSPPSPSKDSDSINNNNSSFKEVEKMSR